MVERPKSSTSGRSPAKRVPQLPAARLYLRTARGTVDGDMVAIWGFTICGSPLSRKRDSSMLPKARRRAGPPADKAVPGVQYNLLIMVVCAGLISSSIALGLDNGSRLAGPSRTIPNPLALGLARGEWLGGSGSNA